MGKGGAEDELELLWEVLKVENCCLSDKRA